MSHNHCCPHPLALALVSTAQWGKTEAGGGVRKWSLGGLHGKALKIPSPLFFLSSSVLPQNPAGVEVEKPPLAPNKPAVPSILSFFLSIFMLRRVSLCPSHPRVVAINLCIATFGEACQQEGRTTPVAGDAALNDCLTPAQE